MVFVSVALRSEAEPIIENFQLKLEDTKNRFSIYSSDRIKLIITGVGKINSAIGTAILLNKFKISSNDFIFNIGICGSNDLSKSIGDIFLVHKVTDLATKKDYYPDVFQSSFREISIVTSDTPVFDSSIFKEKVFVDMESSGFFEASSVFFGPDRIFIIKILSDFLEKNSITKNLIRRLVKENVLKIEDFLNRRVLSSKTNPTEESNLLSKKISENFQFTKTQSIQLNKKIISYNVRNKKLPGFLNKYIDKKTGSKQEGKTLLKEIFSALEE